uniref:Transmembrane protein 42a n=1 Tax=Amphilophus citrinellus TaxID=61819 RepID=A0A3Q0R9K8_AMPCI
MFSGSFYALLAGFLGATASLSAKLSLGLLFACNAVMWTFFSKALRHSNFISSVSSAFTYGLLGRLFFGEAHATLWWVGISLTLCGLLVLHGSTPQTQPREEDKKEK